VSAPNRTGLAITTHGLVHIYHADGHDIAALSGVDLRVAQGEIVGCSGRRAPESRPCSPCAAAAAPQRRDHPIRTTWPR
jgi:hypothetical protein